jgi:predicted transcriptional regulator
MVRPRLEQPTPAELEILKLLWEKHPSSVRDVHEALNRRRKRAYTSVMSLMNVMVDKRILVRKPAGRAFLYSPRQDRQQTLRHLLGDLLGRAFEGSASALVAHLLEEAEPDGQELSQIRKLIETYKRGEGGV